MKQQQTDRFVNTNTAFETSAFAVKGHNMRHLMSIMRDQLYSDKILAPIREYSCNAYDANVENGKGDVPIKITLPTSYFPEFKVRDYGKGLDDDGMREIFCSYGESTKRSSDEYIGQLGIGSKSGFAYGDNFVVRSFIQGVVTTYNAVLGEDGVGTLITLTKEPSPEPSGLEVCIPVNQGDIDSFKLKSLKFLKFWNVYPNISGISSHDIEESKIKNKPVLSGDGWDLYTSSYDRAIAVMGNISYPIDWNLIDLKGVSYQMSDFIRSSSLTLKFKIGELDMSPSREHLQYTGRTKTSIRKVMDDFILTLRKSVDDKISASKNLWDASIEYTKLVGYSGTLSRLSDEFSKSLMWRGILVSTAFKSLDRFCATKGYVPFDPSSTYFPTIEQHALNIYNVYSSNRLSSRSPKPTYHNCMVPSASNAVVIDDVDGNTHKINIKKVIAWYLKNTPSISDLYVLTFNNAAAKKSFYDKTNFHNCPTTNLSTIYEDFLKNKPKIVRKSRLTNGLVKVPVYTFCSGYATSNYETIDPATGGGYMMNLNPDKRVVYKGILYRPEDFVRHFSTINSVCGKPIDKIYGFGVRLSSNKKLNKSSWKNIDIILDDHMKSTLVEDILLASTYDSARSVSVYDSDSCVMSPKIVESIKNDIKDKTGTFYSSVASNNSFVVPSTPVLDISTTIYSTTINSINHFLDDAKKVYLAKKFSDTKCGLISTWKILNKSYGLLRYLGLDSKITLGVDLKSKIVSYINMVDRETSGIKS